MYFCWKICSCILIYLYAYFFWHLCFMFVFYLCICVFCICVFEFVVFALFVFFICLFVFVVSAVFAVFVCTLPPFLPWPLIPFVKLTDRAPGTQITLRVSSEILRYTNIYKIWGQGGIVDIWATFSRSCGEFLPQISPQLALVQLLKTTRGSTKRPSKQIYIVFNYITAQREIPPMCISSNVFLQIYSWWKCGKAVFWWCYPPLGEIKLRINLNSLEAISVSNGY